MLVAVPGHIDAPCWHERSAVGTAAKSSTGAHRGPRLVDRAARRLRSRPAWSAHDPSRSRQSRGPHHRRQCPRAADRSREHPEPDRQRDRRRALSRRAHAQVGPGHRSAAGRRRAAPTRSGICAGAATGSISCSPATWTRPIPATRSISPATASSPRRSIRDGWVFGPRRQQHEKRIGRRRWSRSRRSSRPASSSPATSRSAGWSARSRRPRSRSSRASNIPATASARAIS